MRATWYVLEDGNAADPNECAPDAKTGALVHKSGVAVAMRGAAYSSTGVDLDPDDKAVSVTAPKAAPAPADRELKPAKKPAAKKKTKGYETR